jgi:hypothetical protein
MNLKPILDLIVQLAPFSIIIAALGLLNNYRQAGRRRKDEKIQRTRELLSQLGKSAYVMIWTSFGDAEVEVAVLRIRDELQKRLGVEPTKEAIRDLISDQRLREAIVHEAFRESGFTARMQDEVTDFARLRATIAFSNELVQAAMDAVAAWLRVRLMVAVYVVMALRDEKHPLRRADELPKEKTPLAYAHQVLRGDAELPRDESLSKACKFIEELGNVALHASDAAVLRLYTKPNVIRKLMDWRKRARQARLLSGESSRLRVRILKGFPADASALAAVIDFVFAQRGSLEAARSQLAEGRERLAKIFGDKKGVEQLLAAADEFRQDRIQEQEKRQEQLETLLAFKQQGIDDPDVDMFLAVSSGEASLLKAALARGANPGLGILSLIRRHQPASEDPAAHR